jgi:hypothetical protein
MRLHLGDGAKRKHKADSADSLQALWQLHCLIQQVTSNGIGNRLRLDRFKGSQRCACNCAQAPEKQPSTYHVTHGKSDCITG